MRFKTKSQVHLRTRGGHVYSAQEGATGYVEDSDKDMCDAIKVEEAAGRVEIIKESKTPAKEPEKKTTTESKTESRPAAQPAQRAPAPPPKAAQPQSTVNRPGRGQ